MAEVLHRLQKKLQHRKKATSKTSSSTQKSPKAASTNPYASRGLEKFASLLEDIQIKQQATKSLVERTASSLSAARSISRSTQKWTASTLVRSAGRCSPETTTQVLQSAPRVAAATTPVKEVQQDLENLREEQGCEEEVRSLKATPRLPVRRCRSVTSTKSAFVMLVTLSAFLCGRAGKVGKPLLAALTCSALIQIWRRWKVSARFMFSTVALYLLAPLRAYLVTRISKQLVLLPRNPDANLQPEVREKPVAAPALSPSKPTESPNPAESPKPVTLPSPSRRLAKKISSGLKKLKLFRSSSPSVSESSSSAPSSPKSVASNHRRECPLSRKLGEATDASRSTHHGSRSKYRILRRQRSAESVSCSSNNRVGLRYGRMLSSETLEQYCQVGGQDDSIASSACDSKRSTSSSSASMDHEATSVAWPLVGLLVTLLFLLVGRVPAIVATSLFFVVVSPHSRGRERRESRAHWEAAARKLHRSSPPPRVGRGAVSPPPLRWH